MSVRKIIEAFAVRTTLPISPNDVKAIAIDLGMRDRITFVGVDLNPAHLLGMFYSYFEATGVYSVPDVCAYIYYERRQPTSWQRLVCCKEMLHMFDHQSQKTAKRDEVEKLIVDMARGLGGFDAETFGLHGLIDQITIMRALAILFPIEAREVLLPKLKSNDITLEEISAIADLPLPFVNIVMGEKWPEIYKIILSSC